MKSNLTRRAFVRTAAAGSAALAWLGVRRAPTVLAAEADKPADALDLAIRTLIDLQASGRMVGIISHVPELKQQMDVQIVVVPGASGSTFDFGDGGSGTSNGHATMQVHNYGAGQTLFAYNAWGAARTSEISRLLKVSKPSVNSGVKALSALGLLSRFVGMVTDSRSFLSGPRHEYFRRLVCNLLGNDARAGLVPDDHEALACLARNVSFFNAREYLGLEPGRLGRGFEPVPA